jgi:hypothetical protein
VCSVDVLVIIHSRENTLLPDGSCAPECVVPDDARLFVQTGIEHVLEESTGVACACRGISHTVILAKTRAGHSFLVDANHHQLSHVSDVQLCQMVASKRDMSSGVWFVRD